MEFFILILFLMVGAAVGLLLAFIILKRLISQHTLPKVSSDELEEQLDKIDWNDSFTPLIVERLDFFIEKIKQKIPLAGLYLSGEILENIRSQATQDITEMIPSLKSKIAEKITQDAELQNFFKQKVIGALKPFFYLSSSLGAGLGMAIAYILYLVIL